MTVAELIIKLQEQDPDAVIVVEDTEFFCYYEIDSVSATRKGNYVEISRQFNKPPVTTGEM